MSDRIKEWAGNVGPYDSMMWVGKDYTVEDAKKDAAALCVYAGALVADVTKEVNDAVAHFAAEDGADEADTAYNCGRESAARVIRSAVLNAISRAGSVNELVTSSRCEDCGRIGTEPTEIGRPCRKVSDSGRVCGGWMKSVEVTGVGTQSPDAVAALRELVRLKDLKEAAEREIAETSAASQIASAFMDEYEEAKPAAWANARKALESLKSGTQKAEIRLNDDGSLDEVCGPGGHLEQMDKDHWFLEIGDVAVWLTSKRRINAMFERRDELPPLCHEPKEPK